MSKVSLLGGYVINSRVYGWFGGKFCLKAKRKEWDDCVKQALREVCH